MAESRRRPADSQSAGSNSILAIQPRGGFNVAFTLPNTLTVLPYADVTSFVLSPTTQNAGRRITLTMDLESEGKVLDRQISVIYRTYSSSVVFSYDIACTNWRLIEGTLRQGKWRCIVTIPADAWDASYSVWRVLVRYEFRDGDTFFNPTVTSALRVLSSVASP